MPSTNSTEINGPPYLVDGHVHLHGCFDENRFFMAAADNFAAASDTLGLEHSAGGILMLTEGSRSNRFADFRHRAARGGELTLEIATTDEENSLILTPKARKPLLIVAGRQVVTAENLEVLALGCADELPDGSSLEETLDQVRSVAAVPVIPWGFGKWRSRRQRALLEVLRHQSPSGIFLGDNGGRASLLPRPALLREGELKGIRNLPGSDPLPFPREETRAGSFGFVLEQPLQSLQPATDLLRRLTDPELTFQTYGSGLNATSFVRNQTAMQFRKHFGGGAR